MLVPAVIAAFTIAAALAAMALFFGAARRVWARRNAMSTWEKRSLAACGLGVCALASARVAFTFVVPHHVMYVDEPWYLETAKNLLARGSALLCEDGWSGERCIPYPKSTGWPVLLAGAFRLFGATDWTAIALSKVLGAITVVLVGVASYLVGGRARHAAVAAFLIACYPAHIAWSSTAETNVPGAAFLALALCGALVSVRSGGALALLLVGSALVVAASIRPETGIAFGPTFLLVALNRKQTRAQRTLGAGVITACAAIAAIAIAPMWTLNREITGGTFLRVSSIPQNLATLARPETCGMFYLAFLVLCAIGATSLGRSYRGTGALVAGSWGALTALVALTFDPHHFSERMLLGSVVCLTPLAAAAGDLLFEIPRLAQRLGQRANLAAALASLMAASLALKLTSRAMEMAAHPPETQRLESQLPDLAARSISNDRDALTVVEWPTVLKASTDLRVMATREALAHGTDAFLALASTRPVYFVCDMFCESGFGGGDESACAKMLEDVSFEAVGLQAEGRRQYGIYRVVGARHAGDPEIACPLAQR